MEAGAGGVRGGGDFLTSKYVGLKPKNRGG